MLNPEDTLGYPKIVFGRKGDLKTPMMMQLALQSILERVKAGPTFDGFTLNDFHVLEYWRQKHVYVDVIDNDPKRGQYVALWIMPNFLQQSSAARNMDDVIRIVGLRVPNYADIIYVHVNGTWRTVKDRFNSPNLP